MVSKPVDTLQIIARLEILQRWRDHYRKHLSVCMERKDWHGVEDTGSDIRDLEAQIAVLKWVLGGE